MKKTLFAVLFLSFFLPAGTPAEPRCRGKADLNRAEQLYFDKNWGEALSFYLKAYESGCQDGVTLYKISFCYMQTGDKEKEKEFLSGAQQKLQEASSTKATLENLFYLANCYSNLGKKEEWLAASRKAIDLFERGQWGKMKDPLSCFRMGKIYLDVGTMEKAADQYRKAFDLNKKKRTLPSEYMRRILVVIAEDNYRKKDFARASEEYEELVKIDPKYENACYHLAVASLNSGQYEKAEGAWKKVIELHLPYIEEAQYNHRIARAALEESPLPEAGRSGKKFKEMDEQEMEATLLELSKEGQDLRKKALEKKAEGRSAQDDLWKARKLFIAACAEYIGRGYFIRDMAITNGFAVQVMRKDAWEIPQEEEPQ